MKKIADFIVDKRYIILSLFILLSIIAALLSNNVNINYDIAKYLPSNSETRIGMDIMEEKFKEIKSSSLNIMFKGISDDEKNEIFEYLKNIDGVSSVDYNLTEDYNKEDYTLYVINVDDVADSEISSKVYDSIKEHFKDYEMYTSGSIAQKNEPVLSIWIVVLAVGCAFIILTVMSESYVEPILFLTAILMAVLLNKGSNVIFDRVSNITDSISAILQMALSMDYSIMLMDRYRQEKEKEQDKVKAMKNALYNAFTAISSSSITTIVGLIALVFMSFTIGRDLGFVLAKGVLLSLICIFFVLPSLILMFDKLITKTKKRSPTIKLNKVGKISYRIRYVATILFILAFIGSYLLKGNLGILYTESQSDKISEVFSENNQIALIYKTEDEEIIAQYLKELEKKDRVDKVLGYSNTINEKLHYDELNQRIKDLGSEVDVEEYLMKLLYYNYYNQNENNTMTFNEFINFINSEVYNNPKMSDKLDETTRKDIDRLKNFTESTLINKKRTASEIANILEIDESKIDDILIYYNSKNNNLKISLNDFINFMNKDVLTNETYAKNIDKANRENLNTLSKFTNKNTITKKMTSAEMAKLFEMSESTMSSLYTYYISLNEIETKMTISEFSNFVLTDVVTSNKYSNMFDESTINNIKMLSTFSNKSIITKNMNSSELANLFGIDENKVKQVLLLKYGKTDNGTTLTISEFINTVTYIKTNTHYLDGLDTSDFEGIDQSILSNNTKYTATEMSTILNIDSNQMYQIYSLIDFIQNNTNDWKMTPQEFVKLMLKNSSNLDTEVVSKLQLLSKIIDSTINDVSYTYKDFANLIGIDSSITKSIYTLYVSQNITTKLTPQEFVNFILSHKNDELLSGNLNNSTINQLTLVQSVMNGTITNKKYSSTELSDLLGIDKNDLDLLYGLYTSKYVNINQTISLKEFIAFILNDVMKNPNYSSNFDKDLNSKLNTINGIMNASLNNTKYTKEEIFAILSNLSNELDKTTVDLLYIYYGSSNSYNDNWTLTVEEFINFLNEDILKDSRFDNFIEDDMRQSITDSKKTINDAKELLIGDGYSRVIINTKLPLESDETFNFVQCIKDELGNKVSEVYIIGDSPMAYEMSKTFQSELNFITVLTMILIFIVVAFTFKSAIIPFILVLLIQCAVYMTMGILSFSGEGVYFIALLIVQSILMGATIDYAILYTSYYIEHRKSMNKEEAVINSYNKSINTILTSASILVIVTFIVGMFTSGITSKICRTLSAGTLCAELLILILLPAVLAAWDRFLIKK